MLVPQCVQFFATPGIIAHQAPLSMGILQARTPEWVIISSSRGIFQGLNSGLLHFRQIFQHVSYQGSPTRILIGWNASFDFESGFSKNATLILQSWPQ